MYFELFVGKKLWHWWASSNQSHQIGARYVNYFPWIDCFYTTMQYYLLQIIVIALIFYYYQGKKSKYFKWILLANKASGLYLLIRWWLCHHTTGNCHDERLQAFKHCGLFWKLLEVLEPSVDFVVYLCVKSVI